MSVTLDKDRIRESFRWRRRWFLALACTVAAITPFIFWERPSPGHISLVVPGALLLVIVSMLLCNWIWRCPVCQARLPQGWHAPLYCPQCAVPLAPPSARRRGFTMAQKVSACVLGPMLILLLPLMGGLGPPQRRGASGRGAASAAIARPTAADIAGLHRQICVADYFLAQRYAGARLRGTITDLPLLQRLLKDRRP